MATTYYVGTVNASDSNAGTNPAAPFATILHGLGVLNVGDTLSIRVGTYAERIFEVDFTHSGTAWTAGNFITVQSYGDGTVTINGGTGGNVVRFQDASIQWIQLTNLTIDGTNCGDAAGVSVISQAGSHLHLKGCRVTNGFNFGISGGPDLFFQNGRIDHNGRGALDGTWGHGIYEAHDNALVEFSEIDHNKGYGLHFYGSGSAVHDNTIRKNNVHDNGTANNNNQGILVSHGANNVVYDNLVVNNIGGGIYAYSASDGLKVYNNTIYNNSPLYGFQQTFTTSGTTLENNIIFNNASGAIKDDDGTLIQDHNTTTDPSFKNAASSDFHLTANSTNCINAGVTIAAVPDDYDGVTRPVGTAYCLGAYEYIPPAPAPTGPTVAFCGGG